MEHVVIRRTFNIGDFESLTIEGIGEHENINTARLLASKKVLELARIEMIRIFNIRVANTYNNPYSQVEMELNGVNAELGA